MIWIYVPPAIFVITLAVLVVVFGKKVARAKKREAIMAPKREFQPPSAQNKERMKQIGQKLLRILEKTLIFFKFLINKTEGALAGWLMRLRSKRSKKQYPGIMDGDGAKESIDLKESIIKKLETTELSSLNPEKMAKSVLEERQTIKTVVGAPLMSKITEQPILHPEDKVKEEALIHRIAENPRDVEAYRELGDYYLAIGSIKDAKDSFKMVLKLRPRDLKAKSSLREIEIRMRLGS